MTDNIPSVLAAILIPPLWIGALWLIWIRPSTSDSAAKKHP